jgi:glycosyltransferase involved in cell wall biosynthesis
LSNALTIDVVMITKNSAKPCLKDSIDSIIRNIPLNNLIIVDSFSTDETIKIINEFNIDKKIVQINAARGEAREIGINEVVTNFFAFVDSDVILSDNWFEKIVSNLLPDTGAIEGNVMSKEGIVQKIKKESRAYTNCTLLRTESIKGITIPKEINVYEDQYIRRYIERNCYKWIKVSDPCSLHLSLSNRIDDAFEIGRIGGKYKLISFSSRIITFTVVLIKRLIKGKGEDPAIHARIIGGHIVGWIQRYTSRV